MFNANYSIMNANYSHMRGNFRRGSPVDGHFGQFGGRSSNPTGGMISNSYSKGFSIGGSNFGSKGGYFGGFSRGGHFGGAGRGQIMQFSIPPHRKGMFPSPRSQVLKTDDFGEGISICQICHK